MAMTCPRCGRAGQTTRFCVSCGTALGGAPAQQPVQQPVQQQPATPQWQAVAPAGDPEPRRARGPMAAVIGGLLVLLLVAGVGGAWLLMRDSGDDTSTTAIGADDAAGGGTEEDDETGASEAVPTEAPDSGAGLDPLGLGEEMVNQPCSGEYLVMLASTGTPKDYASTLSPALGLADDNHYLVTNGSCESFNQEVDGNPIYASYVGPFDDLTDACSVRESLAYQGAYVRLLDAGRVTRSLCECAVMASPYLTVGSGAEESVVASYDVVDLQALLNLAGQNPDRVVDGYFTATTRRWVRDFQRAEGLVATGAADVDTWSALRTWCED